MHKIPSETSNLSPKFRKFENNGVLDSRPNARYHDSQSKHDPIKDVDPGEYAPSDVQRAADCCEGGTSADAEWAGELHERTGNLVAKPESPPLSGLRVSPSFDAPYLHQVTSLR